MLQGEGASTAGDRRPRRRSDSPLVRPQSITIRSVVPARPQSCEGDPRMTPEPATPASPCCGIARARWWLLGLGLPLLVALGTWIAFGGLNGRATATTPRPKDDPEKRGERV